MSKHHAEIKSILKNAYDNKKKAWIELKDGDRYEGIIDSYRLHIEEQVTEENVSASIHFQGDDKNNMYRTNLIAGAGTVQGGG